MERNAVWLVLACSCVYFHFHQPTPGDVATFAIATVDGVALTFVALQRDSRRGDQMANTLQFIRYRGVLAVQFQQYISGGFRMQY